MRDKVTPQPEILKHFTNVGCLKLILKGGMLFSDGTEKNESGEYKWDDKNDAMLIDKYKNVTGKTPYTLCFIPNSETLHHWVYYGRHIKDNFSKTDKLKCYIGFDYKSLNEYINLHDEYMPLRNTEYAYIKDLYERNYTLNDLLYIKRKGFRVDEETRLVCISRSSSKPILSTNVNAFIRRIVIAPNVSDANFLKIKEELNKGFVLPHIKIVKSTLYYSKAWDLAINEIIKNNKQ